MTEDTLPSPKEMLIRAQGLPWPPTTTILGTTLEPTKMATKKDEPIQTPLTNFGKNPGLVPLNSVKPEQVDWLWDGHIPLGKITIFDGDPGNGKSTLSLDLTARVSKGAVMPDGTHGKNGGAVIITGEDGLADTIVPRLNAGQADLSKIVALQGVPDDTGQLRPPTVADIGSIEAACKNVDARLVIIDPIMAHLPGSVNSFRDQDIRRVLTPLARMAEEIGVAVIIIRHLNKSGGSQAIYRGGGSIGIIGATRTAFIVAKDPEDEDKRIFAPIKNNLAQMPPSLSFSLESTKNGVARIIWHGVSDHKADALLAIPSSPKKQPALNEAKDFLWNALTDGPIEARTLQQEARADGIADKTLFRAKKALNIKAQKAGFNRGWVWTLPEDGQATPKMVIKKHDHLQSSLATFGGQDSPRRNTVIEVQEVFDEI